ncbi:MAG TPA: hypothetical protein VMB47_17170 [Candidatus Aquilonibacter sp.]|nr:hypothetical protein [Candidatus Aquilonibacter sp.]
MHNRHASRLITLAVFLTLAGCNKTGTSSSATNSANPAASSPGSTGGATDNGAASSSDASTPAPAPVVVPEGKALAVTIDQDLSTKDNSSGDHFAASLAAPVIVDGNEVLPRGTHLHGTITESDEAGHVKGVAVLTITLSSIELNGQSYPIHTTSYTEEGKARGKRTGIGAGGGAAFGAIVGALAGGGKGAAIGAAAGGGAGAAGAAYTGDRDVSIPAEREVHFRLTRSVTLSQ